VKLQCGGHLFLQNWNSYISAMNSAMSTKVGLLIDFDIPNTVASTRRKPEVVYWAAAATIFKNLYDIIFRHWGVPIWMKFGNFMQNIMRITVMWSKSKPEEEFQYCGRLFLQIGNSYISAVDWVILTIVKLRHIGRHLENRQDVISPPRVIRYWWSMACLRRMTWQLRRWGQNRNWNNMTN